MIQYIYILGVYTSLILTPLWVYFFNRRMKKKLQIVDIISIPIACLLSWIWVYNMFFVFFVIEDKFEVKDLGM